VFLIDNSNNLLVKKALHFLAEIILMNSRDIVEIEVENVINIDNFDGKDEVEEEQILHCIETVASTSSKYLIY